MIQALRCPDRRLDLFIQGFCASFTLIYWL